MTNRKNLMKLYITSMLISSIAIASTAKVSEPKLIKGTSIGKYAKPGAPVDISYTSQNVEVGESAEVNIDLSTSVQTGTMSIKVKMDKQLSAFQKIDKNVSFTLGKSTNNYPLKMYVSAEADGVYYIKLLVTIKGKGSRAFAVPVYVGEGRVVKKSNSLVEKTASGENISVSKAVESVK